MIQNIKYLIENFLGFNPADIARIATKEPITKRKGMGGHSELINLMEKDLAINTKYQSIVSDSEFPLVYENKQKYEYFVGPRGTYERPPYGTGSYKSLGTRKRKMYPKEWFYYYTVILEDDGLEIYVNQYKTTSDNNLNISTPLYNFIKHCDFYNIKSITFRQFYCFKNSPSGKKFDEKIIEWTIADHADSIRPFKDESDKKFAQTYISNFPEEIYPQPLPEYAHITNPNALKGLISLWNWQFKDYNDYFWFVRKLIKLGFSVRDKDDRVYNADNIDEGAEYKISGQDKKDKEAERADFFSSGENFIKEQLGEEYTEKYIKMIEHISKFSKNNNVYLYNFNTLRGDNKICYDSTVYNLALNNGLFTDEELTTRLIKAAILYKMLCIMDKYDLKSYKTTISLDDCFYGWEVEKNQVWYEKTMDIKELPIKYNVNPLNALFVLYYTIGLALKQCQGIDYSKIGISYSRTYDEYGEMYDRESYNDENVKRYNNGITDVSDIDFSYLTQQIKTITDKYLKKNKIKL